MILLATLLAYISNSSNLFSCMFFSTVHQLKVNVKIPFEKNPKTLVKFCSPSDILCQKCRSDFPLFNHCKQILVT